MKRPIVFGKYLLLERINVGGMAEVFIAKAFGVEGFERILAIKKILPTMAEDEEFIAMFIDEARISVQLNHTNIVHIHELGKHNNAFYIAMEYVAGRDLRTLLERYRKKKELMPTVQAAYLAARICEGLDYAHRKKDARGQDLNIIHRDVSPQNILVSYDGEVKIIDFGIAKAANRSQKTQAGILKGKFGYMSPEQVRGLPIDRRSDIFAVGVILYEMLTGERLFVGESDFSTLDKVRNADVPLPSTYNPKIPPELEKVVLKALTREPSDRYQWASDLQEDLMKFLLAGDGLYSVKNLGAFMKATFAEELLREEEKMERFATISRPEDLEASGVVSDVGTPSGPSVTETGKETEPGIPMSAEKTVVVAHGSSPEAEEVPPPEISGSGLSEVDKPAPLFDEELSGLSQAHRPKLVVGAAVGYTGETVVGSEHRPAIAEEEEPSQADSQLKQFTHLFPADAVEPSAVGRAAPKAASLEPAPAAPRVLPQPQASRGSRSKSQMGPETRFWVSGGVALAALVVLTIALINISNPPSAGILVRISPEAPGMRITVGGQVAKNNAVTDVEPNSYEVVASAPGYLAQRRVVAVSRGETAVVSIVLERPVQPQAESPGERVIPPPVQVPPPVVEPQPSSRGERRVEVMEPPAKPEPVPERERTSVTRRPVRKESRTAAAPVTTARAKGKLACSSNPAGAEVWVNGKPTGRQTPVALSNPLVLPTGKYEVVFKLAGKQSAPMSVSIKENEVTKLVNVVVE